MRLALYHSTGSEKEQPLPTPFHTMPAGSGTRCKGQPNKLMALSNKCRRNITQNRKMGYLETMGISEKAKQGNTLDGF